VRLRGRRPRERIERHPRTLASGAPHRPSTIGPECAPEIAEARARGADEIGAVALFGALRRAVATLEAPRAVECAVRRAAENAAVIAEGDAARAAHGAVAALARIGVTVTARPKGAARAIQLAGARASERPGVESKQRARGPVEVLSVARLDAVDDCIPTRRAARCVELTIGRTGERAENPSVSHDAPFNASPSQASPRSMTPSPQPDASEPPSPPNRPPPPPPPIPSPRHRCSSSPRRPCPRLLPQSRRPRPRGRRRPPGPLPHHPLARTFRTRRARRPSNCRACTPPRGSGLSRFHRIRGLKHCAVYRRTGSSEDRVIGEQGSAQ